MSRSFNRPATFLGVVWEARNLRAAWAVGYQLPGSDHHPVRTHLRALQHRFRF